MNVAANPLELRKVGLIKRAADAERPDGAGRRSGRSLPRLGEMVRIITAARSSAGLTPCVPAMAGLSEM